jgi:hypothetical protein
MNRTGSAVPVVFVLALAACDGGAATATGVPAATPSPSSSSSATAVVSTSAGPASPAGLPFSCAAQTGGTAGSGGTLTDVQIGHHPGYDRLVLTFANASGLAPQFTVTPQGSSHFVHDASGMPANLLGDSGWRLAVTGATGHGGYGGSTDLKPAAPVDTLAEAAQTGDFEGVINWGLGIHGSAVCVRAGALSDPPRVVVDVKSPS